MLSIEDPLWSPSSHPDDYWSDFSDIGRKFHGKVLTFDEYARVEAIYIELVRNFLGELREDPFTVISFHDGVFEDQADDHFRRLRKKLKESFSKRTYLDATLFADSFRATLRNYVWCKFGWADGSWACVYDDYFSVVASPLAIRVGTTERLCSDPNLAVPSEVRVTLGPREVYP